MGLRLAQCTAKGEAGTGAPVRCAPPRRTGRPGGRSRAPLLQAHLRREEVGGEALRRCPGPGSATLHLPSPHQGQVVMAAAFTVAVIDLAWVLGLQSLWLSGPLDFQRPRLIREGGRGSGR